MGLDMRFLGGKCGKIYAKAKTEARTKAIWAGEKVWVEKRISPLRAARFGRNDVVGRLRADDSGSSDVVARFGRGCVFE